jgi:hypothetical protein
MVCIMKSLVFGSILLGILSLPVLTGGAACTEKSGSTSSETNPAVVGEKTVPAVPDANADIVYYFMTTQRCPSCMKIEGYSKEAVQKNFAEALKKGTVVWKMVRVDRPENSHFIKDYQLYTKSVVLVKMRGGKQVSWKNLDKVWELLGDKAKFQKYINDEVKKFVDKK